MLFSLAKNDFRAKYAGSALGTIWAFVSPVITIMIYWFVFQVAFGNSDVAGVPYVLWLVSGIIPWFFIQEAWGGSTGVLLDYSYLVKKVVFKVEILPAVRIISAFFVHLFFVLLLFIINYACGQGGSWLHFQVIYYMIAAVALTLVLGRITSTLTVFARDISNVVGVFVQFGFWITPLFWNIQDLASNPTLVRVLKLNPFYYITEGYRETFVYGIGFWQHPWLTLYFWCVVAILAVLGKILFKKLRPHLADLL